MESASSLFERSIMLAKVMYSTCKDLTRQTEHCETCETCETSVKCCGWPPQVQ